LEDFEQSKKYLDWIDDLRRAESPTGIEFNVRFLLMFVASLLAWLLLGLVDLPIWVATIYVLVFAEKNIISSVQPHNARKMFIWVLGLNFSMACVFAYMPIYLWLMDGTIWKFATLVLIVGETLNVFLLRARNWRIGLAYLLPIIAVFFVLSFGFFEPPNGGVAFWAAVILSMVLSMFIGIAIWASDRFHGELKSSRTQFMQSQKVEALGTLTGGISHDFNNILSVIQGNLELLRAYPDSEDAEEYLTEAIAATQRGAVLTRQLLAYVRKAELLPRPLNPTVVVQEFDALARRVLPESISIEISTPDLGLRVLADENMLQSALLNLVINARDVMPQGGELFIEISSWVADDVNPNLRAGAQYIQFDVNDTGPGIAEDILPRVFDPFFTTKDLGKGTGLGLAMVQGFARQSGGELTLSNRAERGVKASLYLPANAGSGAVI